MTRASLVAASLALALGGVARAEPERPATPDGNGRTTTAPKNKPAQAGNPNATPPKPDKPERFEGDANSQNPKDDVAIVELWYDAPGEPVDWVKVNVTPYKNNPPTDPDKRMEGFVASKTYPPAKGRYRIRVRWKEWNDKDKDGEVDSDKPETPDVDEGETKPSDGDPNTEGVQDESWGPVSEVT